MGHYAVHAQRQARRREERAFMARAGLGCSGLEPAGPRCWRKRTLGISGPACSAVEPERRPNGRRRTLETRPFWATSRGAPPARPFRAENVLVAVRPARPWSGYLRVCVGYGLRLSRSRDGNDGGG